MTAVTSAAVLLPVSGAFASSAEASTYTLAPTADAATYSAHPNTNYGSATTMSESYGASHAYLSFNIPKLDGPIQSATLQLYSKSSSSYGILVRSMPNSWTESGITWHNAPAYSSTVTSNSNAVTSGQWSSNSVTGITPSSGQVSFALTSNGSITQAAREAGSASAARLVITTTASTTSSGSSTTGSGTSGSGTTGSGTSGSGTSGSGTSGSGTSGSGTSGSGTSGSGTTTTGSTGNAVPYASTSPWNTPIGASPTVDPNSTTDMSRLTSLNQPLTADTSAWTPDVYIINSQTQPYISVNLSGSYHTYDNGDSTSVGHGYPAGVQQVQIPANAMPAGPGFGADGDNQVIAWDPNTGVEYECWQWDPGTAYGGYSTGASATNCWRYHTAANTLSSTTYNYNGIMADGAAGRGGGTPYLAGLVRPWEIAQGQINHALAWAYTSPTSGHVYPSYKSDGSGTAAGDMPEGTRIQLDPTLTDAQLQGMGCTAQCLTIAHALQTYGAYLIDNSGSTKIYLESSVTANWGTSSTRSWPSALTPGSSYSHFRVIDTPQGPA